MRQYSFVVVRTEVMTITEAHPYHQVITADHKGRGVYAEGYNPQCPKCRGEGSNAEKADVGRTEFPR